MKASRQTPQGRRTLRGFLFFVLWGKYIYRGDLPAFPSHVFRLRRFRIPGQWESFHVHPNKAKKGPVFVAKTGQVRMSWVTR